MHFSQMDCEEIEALTTIDTLRRAGLDVEIVSVTPDEIVVGAHDVSVLCDKNFENCDFFDAEAFAVFTRRYAGRCHFGQT